LSQPVTWEGSSTAIWIFSPQETREHAGESAAKNMVLKSGCVLVSLCVLDDVFRHKVGDDMLFFVSVS
jgi:hypothetical protein